MSELELFQLLHDSVELTRKSVGSITKSCHEKSTCLNLLILHNSSAYQSNDLQLEQLIYYKLFNSFCFGALPRFGLQRILAQYKYSILYYVTLQQEMAQ